MCKELPGMSVTVTINITYFLKFIYEHKLFNMIILTIGLLIIIIIEKENCEYLNGRKLSFDNGAGFFRELPCL